MRSDSAVELSILMPCLNEAETVATCVRKARLWLASRQVAGEVLIADNGSTDGSRELAEAEGARVVPVAAKGYGSALTGGIAAARGIVVSGTRGAGNPVPELTLGMMIALTRHFAEEDAAIRSGGWQHTIGPGLGGLTLGVLGLGRLGGPVADLARAFGMEVIAWDRSITPERAARRGARAVERDALFGESDILTIHLPLTESSRGLVGARELGLMKSGSYLINTSRGPIVDEAALLDALARGGIAGAALDVYDAEPLPADHPLRRAPNTLLLPHLGYVTTEQYARFYGDAVEDIVAWADGAPIRVL